MKELPEIVPMSLQTLRNHVHKLEHCQIVMRLSRNGGMILGDKADDYMKFWLASYPVDGAIGA
jgi:hypothetical protein